MSAKWDDEERNHARDRIEGADVELELIGRICEACRETFVPELDELLCRDCFDHIDIDYELERDSDDYWRDR